jgi:hypothetical protein
MISVYIVPGSRGRNQYTYSIGTKSKLGLLIVRTPRIMKVANTITEIIKHIKIGKNFFSTYLTFRLSFFIFS